MFLIDTSLNCSSIIVADTTPHLLKYSPTGIYYIGEEEVEVVTDVMS